MLVTLLSFGEYVARMRATYGRIYPAFAFLVDWREIVALRAATRIPTLGKRLLVHEYWHAKHRVGNDSHAPWYTFRVECGHYLRLRDPARLCGDPDARMLTAGAR